MEKCKTKMEVWLFTSHTFEWLLARRIEKKIPDSLLTNKSYCIGPLIIWVEEVGFLGYQPGKVWKPFLDRLLLTDHENRALGSQNWAYE